MCEEFELIVVLLKLKPILTLSAADGGFMRCVYLQQYKQTRTDAFVFMPTTYNLTSVLNSFECSQSFSHSTFVMLVAFAKRED